MHNLQPEVVLGRRRGVANAEGCYAADRRWAGTAGPARRRSNAVTVAAIAVSRSAGRISGVRRRSATLAVTFCALADVTAPAETPDAGRGLAGLL